MTLATVRPTCLHCNSEETRYQFKLKDASFAYQCVHCDLVFLYPEPTNQELEELYEPHRSQALSPQEASWNQKAQTYNAQKYVREIIDYAKSTDLHILSIGSQPDVFNEKAKQSGFQVSSLTLDSYQTFDGSQPLAEMFTGSEGVDLKEQTYDVCVLLESLDRIQNVEAFLEQVKERLKDDGMLYVVVPSLSSWRARIIKSYWKGFKPNRLFYFDQQNLESFLVKSGFTDILTFSDTKMLDGDYSYQNIKIRLPLVSQFLHVTNQLINTIIHPVDSRFLGSGISTICRKKSVEACAKKPLLSIVMPVYNEKETFADALECVIAKQLDAVDKEIIIVESNSTDGTKDEVAKYEDHPLIQVIYETEPKGKGHAVRAGLEQAKGDLILIQDADLEYDVEDYDDLLEPLLNHQRMFVLGSRHTGSWKMRHFEDRKALATLLNIGQILFTNLINVGCGARMKDPFTMYKVFRKECMYGLRFEANRFDFDWEIVIKFLRKKYYPLEVPVNYNSRSFSEGKKVRPIKDPIQWIQAFIKFRFCKLIQNP